MTCSFKESGHSSRKRLRDGTPAAAKKKMFLLFSSFTFCATFLYLYPPFLKILCTSLWHMDACQSHSAAFTSWQPSVSDELTACLVINFLSTSWQMHMLLIPFSSFSLHRCSQYWLRRPWATEGKFFLVSVIQRPPNLWWSVSSNCMMTTLQSLIADLYL